MAGYLIAVNYTDSNKSQPHTVLLGIDDGVYLDQTTAIMQSETAVTAYVTAKGLAPINMTALISQTRGATGAPT